MSKRKNRFVPVKHEESGVILAWRTTRPEIVYIDGERVTLPTGTLVTQSIASGAHYALGTYHERKVVAEGQYLNRFAQFGN